MFPPTIYLITGANRPRGIGFSLTKHILASHDNAIVYAGVRDPEGATELQELIEVYPNRLIPIKYIAGEAENNTAIAKEIEGRHGRVDTVVANAALLNSMSPVNEVSSRDMMDHFQVNVLGPITLFQSTIKLLKESKNPRFIPISSYGGSISGPVIQHKLGSTAYSTSKAALNWITRKIHFQNEWIVAFPISPGGVHTDMYDYSTSNNRSGILKEIMRTEVPTAAQAAILLLKLIDESTRESNGGEFMNIDGAKLPW